MNLLWVLQLLIDVALGATLLLFWWWKRSGVDAAAESRVTDVLNLLEQKTENWEKEASKNRVLIDENLGRLVKICNEASQILERNRWQADKSGPSSEEMELRSLSEPKPVVESARERITSETSVDLRALLQEQLT